jgi:hypothetical protein
MLKVIPPGAQVVVTMGQESFVATVNSVRIDPNRRVTYFVGWVDGGECSFEWLEAFAVEAVGDVDPMRVDFEDDDAGRRDG